jgi:large-conductance mechanosensitive channel
VSVFVNTQISITIREVQKFIIFYETVIIIIIIIIITIIIIIIMQNLNYIRRKNSRHFRSKQGNAKKTKLVSL